MRRLEGWTKLLTELPSSASELDICRRLAAGVRNLFDGTRRAELFLLDDFALNPTTHPKDGKRLLEQLCAGIDAIHSVSSSELQGAQRIPYLVAPQVIPAEEGHGPLMSAPLLAPSGFIGLLVIEGEDVDFSVAESDALMGAVNQISALLARRRSEAKERERNKRLSRDLQIAGQIQRQFLPHLPPVVGGFRVAAVYQPAFSVGGDFYDVVQTPDGVLTAVVGDVSGKGMSAALVMSRVTSTFRRLAQTTRSPQQLLTQLDAALAGQFPEETFVTAACVRLDAHTKKATVVNAGHVLPIVRRRGAAQAIDWSSGPPLGMTPGHHYEGFTFDLTPGDIVLLCTDGVVEALNEERNPLELGAMLHLVGHAPQDLDEIHRRILAAVAEKTDENYHDDVTLLAFELTASA